MSRSSSQCLVVSSNRWLVHAGSTNQLITSFLRCNSNIHVCSNDEFEGNQMKTTFVTTRKIICAGQTPITGHPPIVIGLTYVNWDFWTFRGIMVASNKTRQCGTSEPVAFFLLNILYVWRKMTCFTMYFHYPKLLSQPLFCEFV